MAILSKSTRLKKELGLLDVYAIAVGSTLSTGFFLLPGLAAVEAGPAVPLAYLIAAIPLIPAVFSMVELSTAMPRAGGTYYFLDRSMGPLMGTVGGLGTWWTLTLKTTFALIGMGAYVHLFLPHVPLLPLAIAFALLFGVVNVLGAKGAGSFQLVLVVGLLAILIWFMGGVFHIHLEHFNHFMGKGFDSIFATAGLVYISYIGITKVASVSEEVKNPERNLPLGVFLALLTAVGFYAVGTIVMVGMVPMDELAGDLTPVATTAGKLVGRWGVLLVVAAAVFAFSSVANAGILSASRYPLAMSRDHILPPFFRKLSARGSPVSGIGVTVGLIIVILILFDPTKIAKLASAFQLFLFASICLAVIVMRESHLDSYDPGFRSPCYPWLQIFGVFSPFLLIVQMGWLPLLFTIGLVVAGTGWFFHHVKGKVSRTGAIYHIFERLGQRRFEGLDAELRGILKEKGLRAADPFDEVVARAYVIDLEEPDAFGHVAQRAAKLLAERVNAGADHIVEGFLRGTRVGATPVSHGAALPHLRLPGLRSPDLVLVRARQGVAMHVMDEFGEEVQHEQPIEALFFLVSSEENPSQHLRILAQIAGRVDDEGFIGKWRKAAHEQDLKEILLRDERYLSLHIGASLRTESLIGRALHEIRFPEGCLIAIVRRGDLTFVPHGNTIIGDGDRLTVIGDPEGIRELHEAYG